MASMRDVMLAEEEALNYMNQINEEASLEKIVAIGFIAVTRAILALGTRLDYVISRASNTSDGR